MKIGLYVLAVLAAIGFELSVISHVAALFESPGSLGKAASWLGFGIFIVMAPAILVTNWVLFYFVAFGMLYSDVKILGSDRRCSSGHLVEEGAQVWGQCGVPVPARDLGPGR